MATAACYTTHCSSYVPPPDVVNSLFLSCPSDNSSTVVQVLDAPLGFFLHAVKAAVGVCLVVVVTACFHSIRLLNRVISCVSTCAVYWILFLLLTVIKSGLLVVFLPLSSPFLALNQGHSHCIIASVGVVSSSIVQVLAVFMLFVSLDHERRFRSPSNAISLGSSSDFTCVTSLKPSFKTHVFGWQRVVVLVLCGAVVALLAAVQGLYWTHSCLALSVVSWVYVGALVVLRLCVVAEGVAFLFIRDHSLKPTSMAKAYLLVYLVMTAGEDLPAFVGFPLDGTTNLSPPLSKGCLLYAGSLHDLLQLVAILALPALLLFIRDQFKRIEQVCRHEMIFEVAKQLDSHDTVSISSCQSDTVVLTRPRGVGGVYRVTPTLLT